MKIFPFCLESLLGLVKHWLMMATVPLKSKLPTSHETRLSSLETRLSSIEMRREFRLARTLKKLEVRLFELLARF